jgi:hypothetical protein
MKKRTKQVSMVEPDPLQIPQGWLLDIPKH